MAAKAHAILSASSSDRWLHCPPSARLCETYEDKGSDYHCDCIEDNVGVVGTFYPEARLYEEVAQAFYERNIFSNSKCAVCAYKFVCLGGCPLGARVKGEETDCSIFGDEEILDNLEFDDNLVFNKRWREKNHETDKEPGNY